MSKPAQIVEAWYIVKCPHCQRPQTIHKWVHNNCIRYLTETRQYTCDRCDENYFITVEVTSEAEKG